MMRALFLGQLVFSSETRSLNEIQDLALFKVDPCLRAAGCFGATTFEVTSEQ
jgi:hypothetical protein